MTGSSAGNFYRSTNFGTSFQSIRTFTPHNLPGMMVAIGPNVLNGNDVSGGAVYVVTNSGQAYASVYTFFVSNNGGTTFTQKSSQSWAGYVGTYVSSRNSVENMRTRPYPMIGADNSYSPFRGRVYCVYASNTPAGSGNRPDIFSRYSTDQGATWSNAIQVNDDPNTTNNHQWMPAMWVDKQTGRLYVQWMDTRNCPTHDSAYVYASYSDDGGNTFVPNHRISNKPMKINCSTCGGSGTPRYQGDYNAITSNGVTSNLVWGDFRNGQFGSFSGYFPDFAMLASPAVAALGPNDSVTVNISFPEVKAYTNSVKISYAVTPTPPAGTLIFTYPQDDSLAQVPGALTLRAKTMNAATGSYTVAITAAGPNGTPVHKRSITLNITGNVICNNVAIAEGWNLLSVPRAANDMSAAALFPTKNSVAYGFDNGYITADTLRNTKGYWMRFPAAVNVQICGTAVSSTTIPVKAGWNMIGAYEKNVAVAAITSTPPGIVTSTFYGFNAGYAVTDSLYAGKGFWVRASQDGLLNIAASAAKTQDGLSAVLAKAGKITVSDASGKSASLYLSNTALSSNTYDLPPMPPSGVFDVRFISNKLIESAGSGSQTFAVSSAQYPIRIRIENMNAAVQDIVDGSLLNRSVRSGEEIAIANERLSVFTVKSLTEATGYELTQNYPNPFNPTTTIKYSLPVDGFVTMRIYDVLGNEVMPLISEMKKSGNYEISFDCNSLTSGTYFYELIAGDFRSVKKMTVVK
jgi:hypothetical protein